MLMMSLRLAFLDNSLVMIILMMHLMMVIMIVFNGNITMLIIFFSTGTQLFAARVKSGAQVGFILQKYLYL